MDIRIDPESRVPLYVQLREQIRHMVLTGVLGPDTRLPPVRLLADSLRVDRNTVAKAYGELMAQGYLLAHPGRGTRVASSVPVQDTEAYRRLVEDVDRLIATARQIGLSTQDLIALIQTRTLGTDPGPRGWFLDV